jgi:hypothetical protein
VTPLDLDQIAARAEAAKAETRMKFGEWYVFASDDIPALVAEVRRLREVERAARRYLHGHAMNCNHGCPCYCGFDALRNALDAEATR